MRSQDGELPSGLMWVLLLVTFVLSPTPQTTQSMRPYHCCSCRLQLQLLGCLKTRHGGRCTLHLGAELVEHVFQPFLRLDPLLSVMFTSPVVGGRPGCPLRELELGNTTCCH